MTRCPKKHAAFSSVFLRCVGDFCMVFGVVQHFFVSGHLQQTHSVLHHSGAITLNATQES